MNLRTPTRSDLEPGSFGHSETLARKCAQLNGRSSDIDLEVIFRQHGYVKPESIHRWPHDFPRRRMWIDKLVLFRNDLTDRERCGIKNGLHPV